MPGEGVSEVHLSTVNYSRWIELTGFSEMSQRTRFTPGTPAMILSRILHGLL